MTIPLALTENVSLPKNVNAYFPLMVKRHDDVIKWKHLSRYWPFVRGIHRSPVNSPHTGQWRGPLIFFSFIYAWINGWVNNRNAGDLRRHRAHYDVNVMVFNCAHCICGNRACHDDGHYSLTLSLHGTTSGTFNLWALHLQTGALSYRSSNEFAVTWLGSEKTQLVVRTIATRRPAPWGHRP